MSMISDDARQVLGRPADQATERDRRDLRREVTSPRRLLAGAGAVVLGLLGGLVLGFAVSELDAGRGAGAAGSLAVAVVLLALAGVVAGLVLRTGRRIVDGYVARCAVAPPRAPELLVRSVLGPGLLLRSALAACGVIASCFAASVVWLAATAPGVDGPGAAMGVVWLVTTTVATVGLLGGELRVVRAEGRRTRA